MCFPRNNSTDPSRKPRPAVPYMNIVGLPTLTLKPYQPITPTPFVDGTVSSVTCTLPDAARWPICTTLTVAVTSSTSSFFAPHTGLASSTSTTKSPNNTFTALASPTDVPPARQHTHKNTTAIWAGVGAALVAIILLSLLGLWIRRRNHTNDESDIEDSNPATKLIISTPYNFTKNTPENFLLAQDCPDDTDSTVEPPNSVVAILKPSTDSSSRSFTIPRKPLPPNAKVSPLVGSKAALSKMDTRGAEGVGPDGSHASPLSVGEFDERDCGECEQRGQNTNGALHGEGEENMNWDRDTSVVDEAEEDVDVPPKVPGHLI